MEGALGETENSFFQLIFLGGLLLGCLLIGFFGFGSSFQISFPQTFAETLPTCPEYLSDPDCPPTTLQVAACTALDDSNTGKNTAKQSVSANHGLNMAKG
jgi:hypothetical protein